MTRNVWLCGGEKQLLGSVKYHMCCGTYYTRNGEVRVAWPGSLYFRLRAGVDTVYPSAPGTDDYHLTALLPQPC